MTFSRSENVATTVRAFVHVSLPFITLRNSTSESDHDSWKHTWEVGLERGLSPPPPSPFFWRGGGGGLQWRKRREIVPGCLKPPVCFALTHTHVHSEICGNLTFGAGNPRASLKRRSVSLLTPPCCMEEKITNRVILIIFSFWLMSWRPTRVKSRKLVNNLLHDGILGLKARYLLTFSF